MKLSAKINDKYCSIIYHSLITLTTAPVLLADCVTTGNGLKNGVHCGL